MDISKEELKKTPSFYKKKLLMDISSLNFNLKDKFDLVFSKMLAEHIKNASQFHKNVNMILKNDGLAVHFFPTLYTFPFLTNKIFSEKVTNFLLNVFAPRDNIQNAKFPAYYNLCRGPTKKQLHRFHKFGYKVLRYYGYFGHGGYYNKLPIIKKIHNFKSNFLLTMPIPTFTSYAIVVLQKQKK